MSKIDRYKKKHGKIVTAEERKQVNLEIANARMGRNRDHTDALSLLSRITPSASPEELMKLGAEIAGESPTHKEQNAALPITPRIISKEEREMQAQLPKKLREDFDMNAGVYVPEDADDDMIQERCEREDRLMREAGYTPPEAPAQPEVAKFDATQEEWDRIKEEASSRKEQQAEEHEAEDGVDV